MSTSPCTTPVARPSLAAAAPSTLGHLRRLSATLALALGTLGAQAAQSWDFSSTFTDFRTWTLLGNATASYDVPGNGFKYSELMLTQHHVGGQVGAGFAPAPLALDFNQDFDFHFTFFIPAGEVVRGDGFTFTLTDTPLLGSAGSGLGYDGTSSASVAFAVDTFHFNGEPVSPSLQVLAGGSVTPLAATETGLGDSIRVINYQWWGAVHYTASGLGDSAGTFTGTIENLDYGSFSVSSGVDFAALGLAGQPVYVGFTGANGLADDGHFITSAVPVPEPQPALLLLAGLGAVGWRLRRRQQN
ncbi:lectin-like domain-containing protein [Roseateles paludis]|jgi:hypothetical protein|uniref:PEP-CTERM sorting domain-containing protein n=1 Tax=Roseateles paludis TaxID=3145238 RepID=A0ABV0G0F0_9BURK